jgi:hypothetical protein
MEDNNKHRKDEIDMSTEHISIMSRIRQGIPPGPEGEHRRRVFKKLQETSYTDPHMVQEHNTCANSEISLKDVEVRFEKEDLEIK